MTALEREALEQELSRRYKFTNGVLGHGAELQLTKVKSGWLAREWNSTVAPVVFPRKREAVARVRAAVAECMQRVREINARLEADLLDQAMSEETPAERAALDVVEREFYGPRARRRRRLSLDRLTSEAMITTMQPGGAS